MKTTLKTLMALAMTAALFTGCNDRDKAATDKGAKASTATTQTAPAPKKEETPSS